MPTTLLLPQIVDAVDIPVIAAGGFFSGQGLVAALAYGAAGIAMGTRFLLTQESTVPDAVKRFYLDKGVADTVVTTRRSTAYRTACCAPKWSRASKRARTCHRAAPRGAQRGGVQEDLRCVLARR